MELVINVNQACAVTRHISTPAEDFSVCCVVSIINYIMCYWLDVLFCTAPLQLVKWHYNINIWIWIWIWILGLPSRYSLFGATFWRRWSWKSEWGRRASQGLSHEHVHRQPIT